MVGKCLQWGNVQRPPMPCLAQHVLVMVLEPESNLKKGQYWEWGREEGDAIGNNNNNNNKVHVKMSHTHIIWEW